MDFARRVLEQQGWTDGQGLGVQRQGRHEAVKVKMKFDKKGVGKTGSEEYTFPWWDHVFNRAAANIEIEDDSDDEIKVKSKADLGRVSAKEPREREKNRFYGMFVKAGEDKKDASDEIMAKKISDEELFEACGGLTGHKAARHGHNLSGKLQRIAAAEAQSAPADEQQHAEGEAGQSREKKKSKKGKKDKKSRKEKKDKKHKCELAEHDAEKQKKSPAVESESKKSKSNAKSADGSSKAKSSKRNASETEADNTAPHKKTKKSDEAKVPKAGKKPKKAKKSKD